MKVSIAIVVLLWMLPSVSLAGHVFAAKVKKKSSSSHVFNNNRKKSSTFFKKNDATTRLVRSILHGHSNQTIMKNLAKIPATQAQLLLQKIQSKPKSQFSDWYHSAHRNNEPGRPDGAVAQLFKLQTDHLNKLSGQVQQPHTQSLPLYMHTQLTLPINKQIPRTIKAAEAWARSVFGFQRDPSNQQVLEAYKSAVAKTPESQISKVTYAAYLLLKTSSPTRGKKRKPGKEQPGKKQTGKEQTDNRKQCPSKEQTGKEQGKEQTGNRQQQRPDRTQTGHEQSGDVVQAPVDRSQVPNFLKYQLTIRQQDTTQRDPTAQQDTFFRPRTPFFQPQRQQREEEEPVYFFNELKKTNAE